MVGVAGVGAEGSIPPAPARLHHQGLRQSPRSFVTLLYLQSCNHFEKAVSTNSICAVYK